MIKYFCSSDIHSFYDEWIIALENKGFELSNPDHKIIVCGDLFDRGDKSIECYDFLKEMKKQNRLTYIRGNHEDLLTDCVRDVRLGSRHIGNHHVSNGTVKTLSQFMRCSEYDLLCSCFDDNTFDQVSSELLQFINSTCVDYFELGDKVFVHGWVPTIVDENNCEIIHENWRDGDWKHARWKCGFDAWRCKLVPEGKTVVCGHWHTSYGWSEFRGRSEWGYDAEFVPFVDSGIVAIDACTAYTHMVNVVIFDEEGTLIE